MKIRSLVAALVLSAGFVGTAAAQQRPIPTPSPTPSGQAAPASRLPPLRYPMAAANFHKYIDYFAAIGNKLIGRGGITNVEVNRWVLMIKDCAAQAEADGVVTRWEGEHCWAVINDNMPLPKEPSR